MGYGGTWLVIMGVGVMVGWSWWGGVGPSGMGWSWLGGVGHNKVGAVPQLWG